MSRYEGLVGKPDNIVKGGRYVDKNKRGHEVCNFLHCNDDSVYGYVETAQGGEERPIRIDDLGAESGADRIDGVDVVWIATNPDKGGRRVIGWYRQATVFREMQVFAKFPSTQHKRDGIDSYRIRANAVDATLLAFEGRNSAEFCLGRGKGWIGESNWWFPERQTSVQVRAFVVSLMAAINGHTAADSERRGHGNWGGGTDIERKVEVERTAIAMVRRHYAECTVNSVEKDNLGWDLEAIPNMGGSTICLEVKGLFGAEAKVGLTPNEYRALQQHMDGVLPHYRLCVATNTLSEEPSLLVFRYDTAATKWMDDVSGRQASLKVQRVESAIVSYFNAFA